uniref:Uncharacterized protein n=1 Tax=Cacopsylla melanoneura TaxID=428564 RepID=A0A8D9F5M6_9HEMI
MDLEDFNQKVDELAEKHNDEDIFTLFKSICSHYNTEISQLAENVTELKENVSELQIKVWEDKQFICQLIEESDSLEKGSKEEVHKAEKELEELKEKTDAAQLELSIKLKNLENKLEERHNQMGKNEQKYKETLKENAGMKLTIKAMKKNN